MPNPLVAKYRDRLTGRWQAREPTETDTLLAVLDMLRLHPKVGLAWRANTGQASFNGRDVRFGFVGQADIVGCLKGGRFFAIEVKSPRGRLSNAQERFLSNVRQVGGIAGVVRSVDEAKLMLDMASTSTLGAQTKMGV
jgi:VRR-NUC domain